MLDFDGIWRYQEITADEIVIPARPNGWVDGGLYRRAHEHSWTTTENWTRGLWTRIYQGITNCNRLIFQLESGFLPINDQDLYESMIAELRVTRACYHYFCAIYLVMFLFPPSLTYRMDSYLSNQLENRSMISF